MKSYKITVNGRTYDVTVEETGEAAAQGPAARQAPVAAPAPAAKAAAAVAPAAAPSQSSGGGAVIKAPMPGTLLAFKVAQGQAVKKGDVILILEAMKMENEITAPVDGVVVALKTSEGATVSVGDPLVELG